MFNITVKCFYFFYLWIICFFWHIALDVSGAVSFNTANFESVSVTNGATLGPNSNLQVNGTSSFAKDASFSQDVSIADDLTVAGSVDITTNRSDFRLLWDTLGSNQDILNKNS